MGKTVVNYNFQGKISPRSQRFQSRRKQQVSRIRAAGNVSISGRKRSRNSEASCGIIVAVPEQNKTRSLEFPREYPDEQNASEHFNGQNFEIENENINKQNFERELSNGPQVLEENDTALQVTFHEQHTCVLPVNSVETTGLVFEDRQNFLLDDVEIFSDNFSYKLAQLSSRHSLTNVCIEDILKLCQHVAYSNDDLPLPRSIKSWEDTFKSPELLQAKFYWTCESCSITNVRSLEETPFNMSCCGEQISQTDDHFVIYNIKDILQMKLPVVQSSLKSNFSSKRLLDLKDSMQLSEEDVLITVNIDGVPRCTSSTASLYPFLAYFDDLSHKDKKKNIMIFGVWVGKEGGKLNVRAFLTPIIDQLVDLQNNGVIWKTQNGEVRKSRVFVTSVLCDSIARPQVQGMKQFNAEYGCGYCFHRESGHYFTPKNSSVALRTNDDHRRLSTNINDSYGVRDECVFEPLNYFDIIIDFPPCILHAVYLGVTKQFLSCWLGNRKPCGFSFSSSQVGVIDKFLKSIKPPYRVSRCPRPLKYSKFYKGHEFCMWLFYYSPIILQDVLPGNYYTHWLHFVRGTAKLVHTKILPANLSEAKDNLLQFVNEVFVMYGRENCTYNVHLLSHFCMISENKGPMQNFSMSIFENFNMTLKDYISSSQFIVSQITRRYCRDLLVQAKNYEDTILVLPKNSYNPRGFVSPRILDVTWSVLAKNYFGDNTLHWFTLLEHLGKRHYSLLHSKVRRRNSCCFKVNDSTVLEAKVFIQYKDSYFVAGELFQTQIFQNLHYAKQAKTSEMVIKPIAAIKEVVIKICHNGITFFLEFLNDTECYAE